MSIDRQGIVDNILGGFGRQAGPAEMNGVTYDKYFLDKWSVPYDPDMATQYLAEAGWPDGFEMEMRCTTGHPLMVEMCEAIAKGMTDVGIDVKVVTLAYSANRPCVVARECGNWWFRTGGEGLGLNPEIALLRRNTVRTFNPGFEIREQLEILAQIDACRSSECLGRARKTLRRRRLVGQSGSRHDNRSGSDRVHSAWRLGTRQNGPEAQTDVEEVKQ